MVKTRSLFSMKIGVDKPLRQSGKFGNIKRDAGRIALKPGRRISKTGNIYYETRRNRTDDPEHNNGKNI